jgi:hypothetical protein
VELDYLYRDEIANYKVTVSIDGRTLEIPIDEFQSVSEGKYRYTASIPLRDMDQRETPADTSGRLTHRQMPLDEFAAEPVILIVEAEGQGTLALIGTVFEFDVLRCHVGGPSTLDEAGNPDFNLQGEGTYQGSKFLIDVSNRVDLFSPTQDVDEGDSIVIEYQGRDYAETTLSYLAWEGDVPVEVVLDARFLMFEENHKVVSGAAFFWGDFVNTDLETRLFIVARGELNATCP